MAQRAPVGMAQREVGAVTEPAPGAVVGIVAGPVLALQFLTAVPIPIAMPASPRHLARALVCFPLAGALLGLALALLDAGLRRALPALPAAAVVLTASVLLTGGLHLDGLMDTADGVFGGRTVERRLEIMRDSRVGSYGALAGALALLLKLAALADLPVPLRGAALVLALLAGRWCMALALALFPSARPDGLGATFRRGVRWTHAALATAIALLLAGALAWLALGLAAFVLLVVAALVALLTGAYLRRALGGLTGDCYGAINEVVEIALLLALTSPFMATLASRA